MHTRGGGVAVQFTDIEKLNHASPICYEINGMLMLSLLRQTADPKRHSYYHPPPSLACCTNYY